MNNKPDISVAPMMDWTDRHCRVFHRLIAPHVRLYTEMVTTGALIHGDAHRHLDYSADEHPVALQLGGSDPADLATSAKMGEEYGYDEINFNCGCPSDRVQRGKIGACLMAEPELVADCIKAMNTAVSVPVTVKCRIGIDDVDDEPFLRTFIQQVSDAGCDTFILHARKAILQGLSPKENRSVPPLRYDLCEQMASEFPRLTFIVNGEIASLEDIQTKAALFRGAMIGRKAYHDPYFLADIEQTIFGNRSILSRETVARAMIPYAEKQQKDRGVPLKSVTRHMLGLFNGQTGAKAWKRHISENAHRTENAHDLLNTALDKAFSAKELLDAA